MNFKTNLLQKIDIDTLAAKVIHSMGPPDSGRKIDKDTMRSLLEIGDFRHENVREMDLYYLREESDDLGDILVLDNELPIYHTTESDVAMRRNPTVKEMISIRNAIKILSDSDVVVSKKDASVRAVQEQLIERLDLTFDESDIDAIAGDGIRSLEREYTDGVMEALTLFAELLDYRKAPKKLQMGQYRILGPITERSGGEPLFGPVVIYSLIQNTLFWVERQVSQRDEAAIEAIHLVALGQEKPDREDTDVFLFLKSAVIERYLKGTSRADLKNVS